MGMSLVALPTRSLTRLIRIAPYRDPILAFVTHWLQIVLFLRQLIPIILAH